jgi:hypothetical protein
MAFVVKVNTDHIVCIADSLKKNLECNGTVFQLFTNPEFSKAYDSITIALFGTIFIELNINVKLNKLECV